MTTTGLSCRHIRRVSRTKRSEQHFVCSLIHNCSRRCGPGYPLCDWFSDKRVEIPFSDPAGILDPDMPPELL